jgi:hypothetical protein
MYIQNIFLCLLLTLNVRLSTKSPLIKILSSLPSRSIYSSCHCLVFLCIYLYAFRYHRYHHPHLSYLLSSYASHYSKYLIVINSLTPKTILKSKYQGSKVEWRKLDEINQLGLLYVHTWKYHKEISCVASYLYFKQTERTGGLNRSCGEGIVPAGKGYRRVNMVQKMYTHVCKCKADTHWNYSRNWGRGEIKESGGGGESKYEIFDTL